jgi:hypothetical protein
MSLEQCGSNQYMISVNGTNTVEQCRQFKKKGITMRKLKGLLAGVLFAAAVLGPWSGGALHAEERPLSLRVIQSGHSLTDPIPDPLQAMIRTSGQRGQTIDRSTIPGSPMDWRWNNAPGHGLPDARHDIADYDMLVITERVALSGTLPWHNSLDQALTWFNHAWTEGNGGNGAQTILYATWVTLDSGPDAENPFNDPEGLIPFRERLDLEMAGWEQILDHVNANRVAGSPPMRMIPGPLLMAALYDGIAQGQVPGITAISDLFSDDIHLNDLGAYYIALAHYAVIYNRDPRGLPNRLGTTMSPSRELADWMQETVWRVVSGYAGAGVSG